MTIKRHLIFLCLMAAFTIWNCGNADRGKNETLDATTTLQSANKETIEPTTSITASINIGGTYSFGDDVEKGPVGSVLVYPLTDNSALFFLDVCRGAPSYNLGQLFGQMSIKGNVGTYDSKNEGRNLNCVLKFEFSPEQLRVTTEEGHDDCNFGHAVYADHTYKLVDKSIPKYFINGESDTVLFDNLTVEKYIHRND